MRIPALKEAPELYIAGLALVAIGAHLVLRYGAGVDPFGYLAPLWVALVAGGGPLVVDLARKALRGEFGSDLLAGISIVTAVLLGQYLAGTLVVLMLSGGEAIEGFALDRASSVLHALAARLPSVAHRKNGEEISDVPVGDVRVGDELVVFPHEVAPVDGEVISGSGVMDEAYLTGEPYMMSKAPGSAVISWSPRSHATRVSCT